MAHYFMDNKIHKFIWNKFQTEIASHKICRNVCAGDLPVWNVKTLLIATNLLQICSKKNTFYLNKMQSGNETLTFSEILEA